MVTLCYINKYLDSKHILIFDDFLSYAISYTSYYLLVGEVSMTKREAEIYSLIQNNPMMTQDTIAGLLNITRTSVGVHISNLQKKGLILGRGYVLPKNQAIVVVGGANVDIKGVPDAQLIPRDSNPGMIDISLGGVARNIAENIALLGGQVHLITALAGDSNGDLIRQNAGLRNIHIEDSLMSTTGRTSTYLYVLDEEGDMVAAIADMAITETLDPQFLDSKLALLAQAKYVVLDANLSQAALEYLTSKLMTTKLVLDPVSTTKALRASQCLDKFDLIKLNRLEAEVYVGYKVSSLDQAKKAVEDMLHKGIKQVVLTFGSAGAIYGSQEGIGHVAALKTQVVNATGAGDAFTAALVLALSEGFNLEEATYYGIQAATQTVASGFTVNPSLSVLFENGGK